MHRRCGRRHMVPAGLRDDARGRRDSTRVPARSAGPLWVDDLGYIFYYIPPSPSPPDGYNMVLTAAVTVSPTQPSRPPRHHGKRMHYNNIYIHQQNSHPFARARALRLYAHHFYGYHLLLLFFTVLRTWIIVINYL